MSEAVVTVGSRRVFRVAVEFSVETDAADPPTPTAEAIEAAALAVAGPCLILPGGQVTVTPVERGASR